MRRALVTGASGQVGAYLVERLVRDGWHVRAMVRAPATAGWLTSLGATPLAGDIMDTARFVALAEGCEAIFHAAALVASSAEWAIYSAANVQGTRNAIAAAAASGARLVQVSSVAVYGSSSRYRDSPTDEETPLAPLPGSAYYARSKREAEALVFRAHAEGRIWGCAVRPDVIYGRYDRQFVPRLARVMRRGAFPVFRGGRSILAVVHAENVADGAVRAVDHPAAGGRAYNLANDFDVTVSDFIRFAALGVGHSILRVPVPMPIARMVFGVVDAGVKLTRKRSAASGATNILAFFSRDNPFSSERARRELGWAPTVRPENGVPEAFRWWRERHA